MCAVFSRCYSDGSFRLTNVTTSTSSDDFITVTGRIEVCSNSLYKSLCHHYWDPVDTQVFCQYYMQRYHSRYSPETISKELHKAVDKFILKSYKSFAAGRPALPSQYGYSGAGVAPYDVSCNGSESRLEDCDIDYSLDPALQCQDPASSAAGVVCTSTCNEFDLRTRNESYLTTQGFYLTYEANIEVCLNGAYVGICDLGWEDAEAQLTGLQCLGIQRTLLSYVGS